MRGRLRSSCTAAATLLALAPAAFAAPADAQEPPAPVKLEWLAPAGCPATAAVLAQVERILGPATSAERKDVTARAVVSRAGHGRWQVALTTRVGAWTGERSFSADSCKALADATALIVALTVDPERASLAPAALPAPPTATVTTPTTPAVPTATTTPSPAGPPGEPSSPSPSGSAATSAASSTTAAPPPGPAPTQATTPSPSSPAAESAASPAKPPLAPAAAERATPVEPASTARHHFALGASGSGELGSLPDTAFGAEVSGAWLPWRLRFELAGAYWAAQTAPVPGRPRESGQFETTSLAGRGCFAVVQYAFELSPCAVLEVFHMNATGFGTSQDMQGSADWVALGGGVLAAWSFARELALRVDLEVRAPLTRPQFVVQGDAGPVHQPSAVGGRGAIGLEFRFF
jgi:hypothetical protein